MKLPIMTGLALLMPLSAAFLPPVSAAGKAGTCIFATKFPEFGKEADYAAMGIEVKTTFKQGEPIFARCYFPSPMGEFRKQSLTGNAQRKEYLSLEVLEDNGKWKMLEGLSRPINGVPKDDWDQAGVDDMAQSSLYSLIPEVIASEAFKNTKAPEKHKLKLCISQNYYIDAVEKWVHEGNTSTKAYDQKAFNLASGCVLVDTNK